MMSRLTFTNSLVFHYASDVGKLSPSSTSNLHISKAEEILNKQSGWLSLTGTTDFSKISSSSPDTPSSHRLAFDLFIGQWIAKDADHKGFSRIAQAPILLLTLFAGPIGLLIWLVIRERRARAATRG